MTKEGFRVLTGPAPYLINMMEPNQTYSVDIYVNAYSPEEFFGPTLNEIRYGRKPPGKRPKIMKSTPDWHLEDLTYTLDDPERNNHEFNYTINLDEKQWLIKDVVGANKTAYVHM